MAGGKGKAKWKQRARRQRVRVRGGRQAKSQHVKRRTDKMPRCSYQNCSNGQPPSTHILRKTDGTFFASCDDCIEPMMHALKYKGIDTQVVSLEALGMLADAKAREPRATS